MDLETVTGLDKPYAMKRGRGRPRTRTQDTRTPAEKRTFICRATYTLLGRPVKCQLRGRHKGIHQHTFAQPGTVVTVTWHPMVSGNTVPRSGKRSEARTMKALELETMPEIGLLVD